MIGVAIKNFKTIFSSKLKERPNISKDCFEVKFLPYFIFVNVYDINDLTIRSKIEEASSVLKELKNNQEINPKINAYLLLSTECEVSIGYYVHDYIRI